MNKELEECLAELIELMDEATDAERLEVCKELEKLYCSKCGGAVLPCPNKH